MKKFLLSLFALLGISTYALADGFSVADVEIRQGKTGVLELVFNTESNYGRSYQIDFDLPEGIVATSVEAGEGVTAAVGKYMLDGNVYEGAYRVAYTDFDESPLRNGVAAYITLEDTEGYPVNTEFTVTVKNQEYVAQDAETSTTQKVNPAEFTFKIKIVEDRLIFDETATTLPVYTAGATENVRMNRVIKAGKWSTIVLPFTLPTAKAKAAFGDDVQLAEFDGFVVDYGEDEENVVPLSIEVNFKSVTLSARNPMAGGKPYLIKTSSDIESFDVDGVTLVNKVTDTSKADQYSTDGKYTGSLVKTVVPADGLFISDEKFYYSVGKTNIKGFRGWLELGAVLDKETTDFAVKLNVLVDGEETAIDDIRFVETKGAVYTLDGKFVGRNVDLKKLQKGIYVVDGKKVAVK